MDSLTRGIGVYPGDPSEYAGPTLEADDTTYRNVALLREVHHSSSLDYNLTGHLVTDGIITDVAPYFIDLVTDKGPVAKREREKVFDDNMTSFSVEGGENAFLLFQVHNGAVVADQLTITGGAQCNPENGKGYDIIVEASKDGKEWTQLKEFKGNDLPGTPRAMRRYQAPGGGSQNVAVNAGLGGPLVHS